MSKTRLLLALALLSFAPGAPTLAFAQPAADPPEEAAPAEEAVPDEGAADERVADEGAADEGAADEGAADDGAADDGAADDGAADEGSADQGVADDGAADDGAADEGAADEGPVDESAEAGMAPDLSEEEPESATEEEEADYTFYFRGGGEYRFRFNAMSNIPLTPLPMEGDLAGTSGRVGQNSWGEQWLRLRGEIGFRPQLRLVGQADVLRGVAFGDLAEGAAPAAWGRDEYGYPGLRLRFLYLEWLTDIGLLRVGQMGFSWGLGIVANDGDTPPIFGDYRYGDLVRRIFYAARPAGNDVPFVVAVAADWVSWDLLADFEGRGDLAFQGILAAYYGEPSQRVGAYGAYRRQWNALDDTLEVGVVDVYARYGFSDGDGGELFAAFEGAYIRGSTTFAQTTERSSHVVEQLMGVLQLGRKHDQLDLVLESGYTSGDSNTEDGMQGRATMDPDHRVGLIMFPEVMAYQTARSAHLARAPELSGRPSRGVDLLSTNGGVAGAFYLFPYAIWRPFDFIEGRLGGVFGYASTDVVDPFRMRALSQYANFRGGDATNRDLGLEIDASVLLHHDIGDGLIVSGGVEGGLFFPGAAFNDASGNAMGIVGLIRLRAGLRYTSPMGG